MTIADTISPAPFIMYDQAFKERLTLEVWKGSLYLSLFADKSLASKKFSRTITSDLQFIISEECKKLINASPSTKLPIVISKWNKDTKKSETDYVIILVKDEAGIYHIEVEVKDPNFSNRFTFSMPKTFTIGSSPMKEQESSKLKLESFVKWLNGPVEIARVITREKYDPSKGKGGSSNNSSSSDNSSGGEYF